MKKLLFVLLVAFAAAAAGQTRTVDLAWSSTATAAAGVTITHEIDRASVAAGATCSSASGYARVGTVPLATRTYADDAPLGTYCYRVSSVATAGTFSSRSGYAYSAVLVVPLAPPPSPTDATGSVRELVAAITLELDGKQVARTLVPLKVKGE